MLIRIYQWPLGVLDMIRWFLSLLFTFNLYAQTAEQVRYFLAFSDSHKVIAKDINNVIDRPFGAWKNLIEFYNSKSKEKKLCLIYRVPYKDKIKGELNFIETSGDCIDNRGKGWVLENIRNLKINLGPDEVKVSYDKGELLFKLYNRSKSYSWESSREVTSLPLMDKPQWDESSWRCRQVNDDCQIVGQDNCHLCPTSTYTVLRSKCPTFQDKYCGKDQCGLKNYPACIRHMFAGNEFFRTGCFQKTDIGLCQKGLVTICDKDKNVICY
jgi:hypothetical protein